MAPIMQSALTVTTPPARLWVNVQCPPGIILSREASVSVRSVLAQVFIGAPIGLPPIDMGVNPFASLYNQDVVGPGPG